VTITEVNENPPRFVPPWTPELPYYTLMIPERQPPGTYVTTMIVEPNVNIVRFFLTNDSLDEFNIFTDTGRLISPSCCYGDYAFSASTLLVGQQEGHPACKKLSGGMLVIWDGVQTCMWPSRWLCHSLSLAPVNRDWFYLPGFYLLVPAHPGSPRQFPEEQ